MKSKFLLFFIIVLLTTSCSSIKSPVNRRDVDTSSKADVILKPVPASKRGLPKPPYPKVAFASKMEGFTAINLFINKKGSVERAVVTETSGFPILDEAVSAWAINEWHFIPCSRKQEPVECWYSVKYSWKTGN